MKKIICLVPVLFSFSLIVMGQTKEIYTHPEFDSLTRDHNILAILPFQVMLRLKPKQMKKLEIEDLEKLEKAEGEAVQNALYTYFLNQKEKDSFKVSFQDISYTNTLLAQAGWTIDSLRTKTKKDICRKLNVDGIISGTVMTTKLMSDEAALLLTTLGTVAIVGLFLGGVGDFSWIDGPGATNTGSCQINVFDAKTNKLLWRYDKTLGRGLGSNTNSVINAMMRKASKKFPYEDSK